MDKSISIRFCNKDMLDYFKKLDPIALKYKYFLKLAGDDNKFYQKLSEYEGAYQFAELTKREFRDLKEDLNQVYKDPGVTEFNLEIYDLVNEKIIRQYINIDGLERLFSKQYAGFEWEMHLGVNHKKHSFNFYRDHFIHQVKDAYMMARLLDTDGIYNKISDVLRDTGSCKLAYYIDKMITQQLHRADCVFKRSFFKSRFDIKHLKIVPFRVIRIRKELKNIQHAKIACHIKNGFSKYIVRNNAIYKETLKLQYLRNIIYMTSYMAGLFHDIGYPVIMVVNDSRRIIDYIAEVYHFEHGGHDFNYITTLLRNSLLFRLIKEENIQNRIERKKIDHGALSALLLLLHFYENGAIHSLEPYKKCAVELAALVIYNHTNNYADLGQDDLDYNRPLFAKNPISYLLRLCDDTQEWGRIYFELSSDSRLILCERCHLPIMPSKNVHDMYNYVCACNKNNKKVNGETEKTEKDNKATKETEAAKKDDEEIKSTSCFASMFPRDQFPYRRIYNVTVCNEVEVYSKEIYPNKVTYNILLKYDLEKLLNIAYLNPAYARYRINELAGFKRFFHQQKEIPIVFVNYMVTANVIFIKSMILGSFVELLYKKKLNAGKSVFESKKNKFFQCIECKLTQDLKMGDTDHLTALEGWNAVDKQILELKQFLDKIKSKEYVIDTKQSNINGKVYRLLKSLIKFILQDIKDNINFVIKKIFIKHRARKGTLKCYCNKVIELYLLIYLISCIYRYANTLDKGYKKILHKIFAGVLELHISKDSEFYTDPCVRIFLQDCNNMAAGMFDSLDQYNYYPEAYFGVEKINETDLYDNFKKFTNADTYDPQNENFQEFNAFTDLYYVKKIIDERKKLL